MKILFLAPEPFYQERGTPIAVYNLLEVMSRRGEEVDVVTYNEGTSPDLDNVHVHRIPNLPIIHHIRPGFSGKKIIADILMIFVIARLLLKNRDQYRYIHAVEEGVFMALMFKFIFGIAYVYDMDSSLSQQMVEQIPALSFFAPVLEFFEWLAVRHAITIVPVCTPLSDTAKKHQAVNIVTLPDVPVAKSVVTSTQAVDNLRETLKISHLMALYVGNLEAYQGIDLLLESFAKARKETNRVDLVIIGGTAQHIVGYQEKARLLGIGDHVHLIGPRPVEHLSDYLSQADIVLSPRTKGINTPMKIYSYLESGKPILATNLKAHTYVLNDQVALLTNLTPAAYAKGLVQLVRDEALRTRLGTKGKILVEEKYNQTVYSKTVGELLDWIHTKTSEKAEATANQIA